MGNESQVPWEFSEAPVPGDSKPNMPTSEGIVVGLRLAKLADIAEAKALRHFPKQSLRCNECAFRAGTRPNGCLETLADAVKCVAELVPFFCHKGIPEDREPKHYCSGWMSMIGKSKADP